MSAVVRGDLLKTTRHLLDAHGMTESAITNHIAALGNNPRPLVDLLTALHDGIHAGLDVLTSEVRHA